MEVEFHYNLMSRKIVYEVAAFVMGIILAFVSIGVIFAFVYLPTLWVLLSISIVGNIVSGLYIGFVDR